MKYDYKAVEAKWQKVWEDEKTFHAEIDHTKPKFYALVEFPYPSGAGLHVGHPRSYTALDVVSRKRRQNGYNVLYPMGWDAFGLPTENFAMKNHIHPAIVTKNNVDHFRSQLKALGFSFDWDREINTTDPEYYKWTQWIFLQLYKHGLAYKKEMNVNWCTGCKCVLANEEVVNGVCERCGSEVVHRVKSQWMLKITAYADKLIDGLDGLDYIERVATQQKNWIGRSHGAEVNFGTTAGDTLTVYTTRCDTLFGATYMVVSPEHAMVKQWLDNGTIQNAEAVKAYQAEAARKSDFERSELNKEKTGVKLEGVMGINPVNDKEIPIFISDYVLATYGTGAIMLCLPTIPATGSLQRSSVCPSSRSSRAIPLPTWTRPPLPMWPPAPSSTPASWTACPSPTPRKRWSSGWRAAARARIRSTTSCATGCSAVSATGASRSPWSSVKSAAGSPCPRAACP